MTALITGSVEVKGLADLDRALLQLGGVVGRRELRGSMLAAMEPMVEAARRNAIAIAKSGALALAMGARFQVERLATGFFGRSDTVSAAVVSAGPIRSDRAARAVYTVYYRRGRPGRLLRGIFHGHLVEFGTRHSPARPVLRPAFDATHQQVVGRFVEELRTRIEKIRARQ